MKPHPKALLIEDELAIRRLVKLALENENYRLLEASDGQTGCRLAAEHRPDVVILDLGLPDMSGLAWLKNYREWNQTPVIVLSARSQTADKIATLDAGANDYLVKPFDTLELLARLRVLRRCLPGVPEGPFLMEGGLKVDMTAHRVTLDGRLLKFTATEEALFYVLARNAGKVVTCGHLLRSLWGNDSENSLHHLHVLIAHVRRKLETEADRLQIETEGQLGYRLLLTVPEARFATI